jgi:hypothetical protein
VFQTAPPPGVARSAYLETVRRIAPADPPGLIGRESELAELSGWCLAPDSGPYAWWQAEKYAGKSALMATFVLRQPRVLLERARVVSFFITARLGTQDTRDAFILTVLEELADLLGESLPPVLPEATREAYLLDLMTRSAASCRQAGRRLVLVVDGLDEDRGVTAGADAHSIAALLPADPPHGMRVIVAGRPNPPVPDDVPDWHPLRDPGIIRQLVPSPHARDIMRLARAELKGLLRGGSTGADLLGLLTAARGGLSGPDLEDLTGVPLWTIEDILHTVDGRTFTRRPGRWLPDASAEVYLLGHEDLQEAATRYFAKHGLEAYRDRLHAWVNGYRAGGWPRDTPEYPLRGYFRLVDYLGDLSRMVECACDPVRHDRMLDLSGGDEAALREVRTALDRIAAQDEPDLGSALALACHRDYLVRRNGNVPTGLPAVWARLGQTVRARALAGSITDPEARALALMEIATALVDAGRLQQAWEVFGAAESARTNGLTSWEVSQARVNFANALSKTGHYEQATEAVAALEGPGKDQAAGTLAEAMARAGDLERAEETASAITDDQKKAAILARIAAAAASDGDQGRASALARQARAAAEAVTGDADERKYASAKEEALAAAAAILDDAGAREQATEVAKGLIGGYISPGNVAGAAEALADAGAHGQAVIFAYEALRGARLAPQRDAARLRKYAAERAASGEREKAADAYARAEEAAASPWGLDVVSAGGTLRTVARVLAREGRHDQAAATAQEALDLISTLPNSRYSTDGWLYGIVQVFATAGRFAEAEALAGSLPGGDGKPMGTNQYYMYSMQDNARGVLATELARAGRREQAEAIVSLICGPHAIILGEIAAALAEAGWHDQAVESAREALALAREAPDPPPGTFGDAGHRTRSLIKIASAFAAAGDVTGARAAAEAVTVTSFKPKALADAAMIFAKAGRAADAAGLVRSITETGRQAEALADVAEALAKAGQYEPGARIAESIPVAATRARALSVVARLLADTDQDPAAAAVAQRAEAAARSDAGPALDTRATWRVIDAARALARAGMPELAEAMAQWMTDPSERNQMLLSAAGGYAARGRREPAVAAIGAITDEAGRVQARQLVADQLALAGQYEQAEETARAIDDARGRTASLKQVAAAMARTGRFEEANALAGSITDPRDKASALIRVAESTAKAGAGERASTLARSITDPEALVTALVKVAVALCETGQEELAQSIAHSITDPSAKMYALAKVATALAGGGKAAAAGAAAWQSVAEARSLTVPADETGIPWVLERVGDLLNEAGLPEQATAVARQAADLARSVTAQVAAADRRRLTRAEGKALTKASQELAVMLAKAGNDDEAVALAQSITVPGQPDWGQEQADEEQRAETLAAVAEAIAKTGRYQRADKVARSITDPRSKVGALDMIASVIAGAHARSGEFERAESAARSITDDKRQAESLTELAVKLAEAGEARRAEATARSITGLEWQGEALARVAVVLAQSTDVGTARRAAAHACAVSTWTVALHPVLLLEPSALELVARQLEHQAS